MMDSQIDHDSIQKKKKKLLLEINTITKFLVSWNKKYFLPRSKNLGCCTFGAERVN